MRIVIGLALAGVGGAVCVPGSSDQGVSVCGDEVSIHGSECTFSFRGGQTITALADLGQYKLRQPSSEWYTCMRGVDSSIPRALVVQPEVTVDGEEATLTCGRRSYTGRVDGEAFRSIKHKRGKEAKTGPGLLAAKTELVIQWCR